MPLIANYILPHPPIVIEEIGKEDIKRCKKTQNALKKVAKEIKDIGPDIILVITPHGTVFSDAVTINYSDKLEGNLGNFGFSNISMRKENAINLVEEIYSESKIMGVSIAKLDDNLLNRFNISANLDHGILVPLHYTNKIYKDFKLVHINYGGLSSDELYKFGMAIRNSCENINERVILIASGDLSHKLSNEGPYSYSPKGKIFDNTLIEYLVKKNNRGIINMDKELCNEAGECGKRSIDILLGSLDGYDYDISKLSYEGPFGVGYGVFSFHNFICDSNKKIYEILLEDKDKAYKELLKNEDIYVKLARKTIEKYANTGKILDYNDFDLPEEMLSKRAGVFVSIKNSSGLRGCIGSTELGFEDNIAKEIIRNAISASTKDPRFPKIEPWELSDLIISVDILEKSKKVNNISELDPKKYGVIVKNDFKKGLLLPNLEGIDTVEKQLDIALKKAGIDKNEDYSVDKFLVTRHK